MTDKAKKGGGGGGGGNCQEDFQSPKATEKQVVSPSPECGGSCQQWNGVVWITAYRSTQVNSENKEGNTELKEEAE